jgi:anionic cell wall polymer biosynthesis LytR-Cps2A-Psr (LCP) family protein
MELRRQRRRRRIQLTAVALAVLLALLVAVTVRLAGSSTPPPPSVAPQERTQRTLLMQVQAPNGDAAVTALLAHDPASRAGSVVLVPPQTLVAVPGAGTLTVNRALRDAKADRTRQAVADALGVLVDGGWVLDQPTLVRLVDAVGGVPVDVDVPVMRQGQVVLQPGSQRLDGGDAVLLATYRAPDEQEQSRLTRVQHVLDALLQTLPPDAGKVQQLLDGLGTGSTPTVATPALADLLEGLRADDGADALQYDSLPVVPIDTGSGAVSSARVDPAATRAVVDRLLAQSVPPGARDAGNRVLVLNGVGTPGLGEQVRAALVPKGFVYVGSRNASRFGYAKTQVLVPAQTSQAQALGARVATALGLGPDVVRSTDQLGTVADVVVLVGADFRR